MTLWQRRATQHLRRLVTRPSTPYVLLMHRIPRVVVVSLIGVATAWLWIRLGLYGFGLPVGFTTLLPLAMLGVLYARTHRFGDLGVLLAACAAVWTAFETWTWLNAASDSAVSIPGWTPVPLAAAVALLVVAGAVVGAASSEAG